MKPYLIFVYLCIIASIISCTKDTNGKESPYNYLGDDTTTLFKISHPDHLQTDLKANDLLEYANEPILDFISTSEILSQWKSQTPFYFSTKGNKETASIVFTNALDTLSLSIDSIPNAVVENISMNESLLKKVVLNKDSLFTASKDSVQIFSTDRLTLLAILEQQEDTLSRDLKKLFLLPQEGDVIKTGMTGLYPEHVSEVKNLRTSQTIQILPDGIQISGIVKSKDSSLIDVFKGQIPQISKAAGILPSDFTKASGFTFSDVDLLISTLKTQKQDTTITTIHPVLETLTEIIEVQLKDESALIMSSIDMAQTLASIELDIIEVETYRDITIFEDNLYYAIASYFDPLVSSKKYPYLVMLDSYVICASSLAGAKSMISAFQNKNVLEETNYYKSMNTQMLSSSSMFALGQGTEVSKITNGVLGIDAPTKTNSKYPLAVLQYSYDVTFAHLNFITKEISKSEQVSGTVSQKFSTAIEQPILGTPQFFTNHRTRGKDVVLQDITSTMHLFSINAKKLWSKKLDGPILGEINEVDLLKNGKKQLAFATKNTMYILDRNGKDVAPFPLKFKDDITQPLAVFDYDDNRKYRFAITQDNALLMYDSKGKIVKGFAFKKTVTPLVFKPQHIRLANKDFIVLAEKNGKATFLSRTGKERIKVNKKINFGTIPVQKEGSKFVIISADKEKHLITASGKLTSQNLNVSENYYYKTRGTTKVTLDDNLLRINNVLVELPFGMYGEPQLIYHNKNTYIAVTDMQEHKVYVYDKNRKLIDGFPVFGTTQAKLASIGKKLLLVTTGSDKEVLCYQMN